MDEKFNKMMNTLREQNPNDLQIQKWKNAIGKTQKTVKSPSFFWFQMTAAVMVGVVLGGLLFGNLNLGTSEKNQEIAFEDATIEVVYTKL